MKTLKRIPFGYLVLIAAFLSLGAGYSATTLLEIGPQARVTGSFPEIVFDRTGSTGIDWEFEANESFFEIGPEGELTGRGNLKINFNASEDALTLRQFGVTVNGEDKAGPVEGDELTVFGAVADSNTVAFALVDKSNTSGNEDGLSIAIENDDTFNLSGSANESSANRIIQGSLAAPEDAITIQPGGMVSVGIPFSKPDPFGGNQNVKLRVPGLIFHDTEPGDWLAGANVGGNYFVAKPGSSGTFEINNDAAPGSLVIAADGNVGMGTFTPDASLHVLRDDGNAGLLVEETSATTQIRSLMTLRNNGGVRFAMDNADAAETWEFTNNSIGNFQINRLGSTSPTGTSGPEFRISKVGGMLVGPGGFKALDLRPNGNLFIAGSLTEMSDRNSKENYKTLDNDEILAKLCDLSVTSWNYKTDDDEVRHIGPVAQEFHAAFGLGHNETTISTSDKVGVNMAAIKALKSAIDSKDELIEQQQSKIEAQQQELEELQDRMDRIEAALLSK